MIFGAEDDVFGKFTIKHAKKKGYEVTVYIRNSDDIEEIEEDKEITIII